MERETQRQKGRETDGQIDKERERDKDRARRSKTDRWGERVRDNDREGEREKDTKRFKMERERLSKGKKCLEQKGLHACVALLRIYARQH